MIELLAQWRSLKRRVPAVNRLGGLLREPAYRVAEAFCPKGIYQALANGDRFRFHPRFIGWNLAAYEPELVTFLSERLTAGAVFLDVGAYVGLYSLIASKRVGSSGRVVAFEPSPASASLLRKHVAWNGCDNVQVVEAAVSDHEGTAWFTHRTNPTDPGGCANSLAYDIESGARTQVRLRTLDSVCSELAIEPNVVKMDVEGAEFLALRGAEKVLRTHRPELVVAVHPGPLRAMGSEPRELVDWMLALGYLATTSDGTPVTVPGFEEVYFKP